MINLLDLFSGIGGFTLASSWVGGYQTVGFCEIEDFCRDLLKKNFPGIPIFEDIKELHPEDVIKQGEVVHLMSSGFPCQDLSVAGVQKGIKAERSGLFFEIMRLSDEFYAYSGVRPALLLENVPNILSGGKGEWARLVYREVASRGYDCEWKIISAKDLGAPHLRKRWWCIAYVANSNSSADRSSFSRENDAETGEKECVRKGDSSPGDPSGTGDDVRGGTSFRYEGKQNVAYSNSGFSNRENEEVFTGGNSFACGSKNVAYSHSNRNKIRHSECSQQDRERETGNALSCSKNVADSSSIRCSEGTDFRGEISEETRGTKPDFRDQASGENVFNSSIFRSKTGISGSEQGKEGFSGISDNGCSEGRRGEKRSQGELIPGLGGVASRIPNWIHEPDIPRVTTVRENRVKRLKALGNSIVPQCAMIPLIRFREIYEEQDQT